MGLEVVGLVVGLAVVGLMDGAAVGLLDGCVEHTIYEIYEQIISHNKNQ